MKGTHMRTWARSVGLALLAVGLLACNGRTDRRDTGNVTLVVDTSPLFPFGCSAARALSLGCSTTASPGYLTIDTIDIRSIVENGDITTTDLSTINLSTYQVVYKRIDGGTTTPPAMTSRIFGTVAPGGTAAFSNLPIMGPDQFLSRPISDLLAQNGGFDRDTGKTYIVLQLQLTFFGKTVSGRDVASNTAAWTVTIFQ